MSGSGRVGSGGKGAAKKIPAKARGRAVIGSVRPDSGPSTTGRPGSRKAVAMLRREVSEQLQLKASELRWNCPPLKPSGKAPTAAFLLAQDRPMNALRTGLSIHAQGYNLFVSGLIGSGRSTVVELLLRDLQPACRPGLDQVFVHNFRDLHRPLLLSLPAGKAAAFRDELHELGRVLRQDLSAALRSRPHRMSRRVVLREGEGRERRIMDALQRQAQKFGCALVRFQSQNGSTTADIYPVVEDEPITLDALSALVLEGKVEEDVRQELLGHREQLLERLEEVSDRVFAERRRVEQVLREMDLSLARRVLRSHGKDFCQRWSGPDIEDWYDSASEFIESNLRNWVNMPDHEEELAAAHAAGEVVQLSAPGLEAGLHEFAAHVVKTRVTDKCPVVFEANPTYSNLFGTIMPAMEPQLSGARQISPGALLRAAGGYLIVRCLDVLREPGVWSALKRALQTGLLEVREVDPQGSVVPSLQPEAIPIDVKVVLIGEPGVYEQLAAEDPQFPQIFKMHAEFDTTIPVRQQNLRRYADYLQWLCEGEHLRSITADGMAAVAEFGVRSAGRRDRLSTRYSQIGDVAREASHLAAQEGDKKVTREHVEEAVRGQRYRHDLQQELVERDYAGGYMQLSTSGQAIGQVNALTVLDTGSLEFGRPCRITCNSGVSVPTRSGLINIEGAVNLSGPIHDKGVMILEGYLLSQYGHEGPLCVQATICFEQLYNGVEGDSASLAQLLALLSSLAEAPLDQGLGVTGSINQKGEVQAVGAVNEKIEGFYRLCRSRRLRGAQGVVVPQATVADLMLDPEVVRAVEAGEFKVIAVAHVNEALELFSGRPAKDLLEAVGERLRVCRQQVGVEPRATDQ
ncbi:MAG: AAA family ATPase [Planctomycetota bacterium]|nr:AAA family ATPase [Planctomycetota bacterium]